MQYVQLDTGTILEVSDARLWPEAKVFSSKRAGAKAMQAQHKRYLLERLQPGATVWTVLRHCSRSGMVRHLSIQVIVKNRPIGLTFGVAKVLGWKMKGDYLIVDGAGMDMGYHTVESLSYALFGVDEKNPLKQEWI